MAGIATKKPRFRVGNLVSFLYGPQRVCGTILEDRGASVNGRRRYLVGAEFGEGASTEFEMPEEDMDAPEDVTEQGTPGLRRVYTVTYKRQEKTTRWTTKTEAGEIYRGVAAKGAVTYTTGRWEGESEQDEKRVAVSVFLEPAPEVDERTMILEARRHADRMFKKRRPDAEIDELKQG